jgi:hypothetical protein
MLVLIIGVIMTTKRENNLEWRKKNYAESRKYYAKEYYEKNKERLNAYRREYAKTHKGKEVQNKANRKLYSFNKLSAVKKMLRIMKSNSLKRNHEWQDCWWNPEELLNFFETGVCCKSGIKFSLLSDVEMKKGTKNPFSPSPDRIDNSRGYEPTNVQWVVLIYNLMKNTFKDAEVELFVNALKENNK